MAVGRRRVVGASKGNDEIDCRLPNLWTTYGYATPCGVAAGIRDQIQPVLTNIAKPVETVLPSPPTGPGYCCEPSARRGL
jgi:hypothetical protein